MAPFRDVLILTQYYWPEPGAPQLRLRNMARELQRLGVRVRVLTGLPNYPRGKIFEGYVGRLHMKEQVDGVSIERVWLYPAAGRGSLKRLANYLSFTFSALPSLLFGPRPDLIFVEAQPLTLALPAWIMKALRGVPYVYNTPDLQVEIAAQANWIGAGGLISAAKALEGFLMRRALAVCTVTHAFIDHFVANRNVPRGRVSFLPNGADVELLRPLPRDESYAEQLGVGGRTVFTYAGTHAHYQGLETVVAAAKLLVERKDIVILMVGQGPVREQLIREAAEARLENILFRDSPFEEMARLMSLTHASLALLKNMPAAAKMRLSKAIPPLACGVPLIYAGLGETAAILEKERCGVIVEPERPDKLAAAIVAMADDPRRREEMGRRGRALALRQFSWSSIVEDWVRQLGLIQAGEDPKIPAE